jgi:lipopolysaccharide export system protein LptA
MKRYLLAAIVALTGLTVCAQTNPPARPPTLRDLTQIHAGGGADFDLSGREVVYHGPVRVDDPQMKLTCEQLTADVPQASGRPNRIVAETNVVIDFTSDTGQTNHATGDKAVYLYSEQGGVTNESVTLTGNPQPQMENAQGTQAGDVIIWTRVNGDIHVSIRGNYHASSRQNLSQIMTDTNSPPTGTTTPAINKTNLPPGTIQNIDRMTPGATSTQ